MRTYREYETMEINGETYKVWQADIGSLVCQKLEG